MRSDPERIPKPKRRQTTLLWVPWVEFNPVKAVAAWMAIGHRTTEKRIREHMAI